MVDAKVRIFLRLLIYKFMLEVLLLAVYILILSPLFYALEIAPIWILVGMLLVSLPGMYAMLTGAPYVPTKMSVVKRMVELAKIKPGEVVYDLGCGDGRIVFAASQKGAKAIGYELSVPTYIYAKLKSLFHPQSQIFCRNFWTVDYSKADVIFCFLLTDTMQKFHREIWPTLKPGCRVVSNSFTIKNLKPLAHDGNVIIYKK